MEWRKTLKYLVFFKGDHMTLTLSGRMEWELINIPVYSFVVTAYIKFKYKS